MNAIPNSLENLINQFCKLPGIGRKTAERLSLFILKTKKEDVFVFSDTLKYLKNNIQLCNQCHCFMEDEKCSICTDRGRLEEIICVVEDPSDVFLVDKTGFKGKYHVLGGLISPIDGIKPEDLNFESLMKRLEKIEEIVIALNPSSEGDMTNLYISKLFKPHNIKLSRLARGVPVGSSLEFIDQITLTHSINDRVEIK